jgi:hypothetical protein
MLIIGCDFHTRYQQIGGWRSLWLEHGLFLCGTQRVGFSVHYLNSFHGQMFASRNDSPLLHWPTSHRML